MATRTTTDRWARTLARLTSERESLKGELLAFASSLWFGLFLLVPLLIVVFFGFTTVNYNLTVSYTQLTTAWYQDALNPFGTVIGLAVRTVAFAIIAAAGALFVGIPIAYYLARICPERHRGTLVSLFVIPFWVSFVVQVNAILPWVDPNGYIGDAFRAVGLPGVGQWLLGNFGFGSTFIVAPALVYIWLPYMILPLYTAFLRIDQSLIEAAQDLGAGKWRTFWSVTFPLSSNGVLTGTILVFITAFGSFVEPEILAGKNGLLIGNYIEKAFLEFGYLPRGAAASVVVLVPTIILLYLYVVYAQSVTERTRGPSRVLAALGRLRQRLGRTREQPARGPADAADGGMPAMKVVRGPLEKAWDFVALHAGATLLAIFTGVALLAWYVPLAQVVMFSFNHDNNNIIWSFPSLRWYLPSRGYQEVRALFGDTEVLGAIFSSFLIGGTVTAISVLIGLPAAMAIVRYRFESKPYLNLMLYTGLVMPSIILGVSILVFIRFLNDTYLWPYFGGTWDFGFWSIVVGHVTFCIPIVIVVLLVSLREFDRSIEEAAMNLGADEIKTFFRVTLPNIMPGLISAALLSFTFSFSEVVVTLFLKGPGVETLPVVIWATLSKHIPTPETNAASTLVLAISIVFVLLANKVQRGGTLYRF
jgi:ABC-type spermidine/putrescine transport system permease subunit II